MKIDIKGAIVSNNNKWIYDWFGVDAVSPRDVISKIDEARGEPLEVEINSGGGDVYAGSEIYTALKSYKGESVGKIVGIAASAASVAAMGVKKLMMSPTGQLMIHKAKAGNYGNHKDFENMSDVLKSHDAAIANAYMLKTGMDSEALIGLMDKETYFNAKSALEHKLIDEVMFDENLQLSASIETSIIPEEVITKMRNYLKQNPKSNENGEATPQPTSYSNETAIKAQQKEFRKLRLKILEGGQ